MTKYILLFLLLPLPLLGKAPECPLYPNKKACLTAVDETYMNYLDYLNEEYQEEKPMELIQAAIDIRHFEALACQKTCLN
jgi:hypothetical protein